MKRGLAALLCVLLVPLAFGCAREKKPDRAEAVKSNVQQYVPAGADIKMERVDDEDATRYNVIITYESDGQLNPEAFADAVTTLTDNVSTKNAFFDSPIKRMSIQCNEPGTYKFYKWTE